MADKGSRTDRRLAVVTCMDKRIEALGVFALQLGDAYVIRNAGGRVTDDVLRSLALASQVLGVDAVIVMQHTKCGLEGATNDELRERTGAGFDFLPIEDHASALEQDIELLMAQPYLSPIKVVDGCLYDVDTGAVEDIIHRERRHS